jgi:hypothetical protein
MIERMMTTQRKPKTVPAPFSGANYRENADRCKPNELPCVFCGKGTKIGNPRAAYTHVVDGGAAFAVAGKPYDEAGDMGSQIIGSDCARRFGPLMRAAGMAFDDSEFSDEG